MNYQDHLTKFVILRPLKTKTAVEVASHLMEIFTTFGAPSILQSDNGREFVNKVIIELTNLWDGIKIVHGKPRHSQSQGSVERANQDVQNILATWMETNKTTQWSNGLKFAQMMKNWSYHEGIQQTPYEAVFGLKMKLGLKTSNLPNDAICSLQSEEDLETIINETSIANDHEGRELKGMPDTPNDEIVADFIVHENGDLEKIDSDDDNVTLNLEKNSENLPNNDDADDNVTLNLEKKSKNLPNNDDADDNVTLNSVNNIENLPNDDNVSFLEINKNLIAKKRKAAHDRLQVQANKMLKYSNDKFPPAAVGETVKVPIPDVDRGTKEGRIKQLYSRNQFTTCKQKFISINEVPDKEKSFREIAGMQSLTGGQGFKRCFCKGKCDTKRCSCRNENLLCNSKCHGSGPCNNK